jgi:hypothetical protein
MALKRKRKSFWERYAHTQLSVNNRVQEIDELYVLSDSEKRALRKIRANTYLKAGLAGAMGVVLLYVPYHLFGEMVFPKRDIWIPFYEATISLEIEFLVYSIVLVFLEIWYLTYVNIHAVNAISKACGYPNPKHQNFEENVNSLVSVGLEKKHKELKKVGINPYEGLSKVGVFAFQVIIKLKAAISGFLWKLIVAKLLGRYALRMVVDVVGAPLYAAWNMYAAKRVMNEARVRVMAPPLINKFALQLHDELKDNEAFKSVLYPTLQAISISKRSFHYNHYLLATALLTRFEIPVETEPSYDPDFLKKVDEYDREIQRAISKLLVFGIIIDGGLSVIEMRSLRRLIKENVLPYTIVEVKGWSKDFFEGKGLDDFFER